MVEEVKTGKEFVKDNHADHGTSEASFCEQPMPAWAP